MNQKFEELREQALREVDYLLQTEGSENGAVMYREHLTMVNQRFAELIVAECADIARQHNNSGEGGVIAESIEVYFKIKGEVK